MWLLIVQRLTIEFFLDIFYFPVWWYTAGAKRSLLFSFRVLQSGNQQLAPGLWLKNIFVPMYGQYDWQGRLMSFFMRSVNVVIRGFALLIWIVISFSFFFLWLMLPALTTWLLVLSLSSI